MDSNAYGSKNSFNNSGGFPKIKKHINISARENDTLTK